MSNQSKISTEIDHAYFTPEKSVKFCHSFLYVHDWVGCNKSILDPCVGSGNLIKGLPGSITGVDIKDHGWDKTNIENYLERKPIGYELVLANPPYGRVANLAVKFFNKATLDSDRLAFVVPASFRKTSITDRLNLNYWKIVDEFLPDQNFILPDGTTRKVKTIFQMWEKRSKPRLKIKDLIRYDKYFTNHPLPTAHSYALRTQGSAAGRVLDGQDYSPASTAFLEGSKDRILSHDWTTIASFTAGIPALGLYDLALGLHLEDIGEDIQSYLTTANHPFI